MYCITHVQMEKLFSLLSNKIVFSHSLCIYHLYAPCAYIYPSTYCSIIYLVPSNNAIHILTSFASIILQPPNTSNSQINNREQLWIIF